ncbi:Ig-like domain-containing protein [uncultured Thomasclavelia sp.]|uniref:Ig-like domain-containing protein n=1 Tax=uncultured Thomasclavelia sp. TaxID=3025759 RepID=UPI0025DA7378|nr:Ig-like domain-containing protein [uncultured Thomasclavelia sp.]
MKITKKGKVIGVVLVLFIFLAGMMGCSSTPEVELKSETLTIEYGQDISSCLKDNIKASAYDDQDIIDDIEYSCDQADDVDDLDVGKYTITYKLKSNEKTVALTIQDTTAPEITLKNEPSIFENDSINYDDLITVKELSSYDTSYDDSQVNYNTPGNYVATYNVKDKYGNVASIDIPVTVNELLLQTSSPASISLNPSGTSKFEVSTNCNDAITYTSSDENVVSVDSAGNLTAKNAGSATITATVKGKNISTNVVVTNPKPVVNQSKTTSSQASSSSSSNDNISYTVYRTKTGDCYHRDGCRYLSRSKIAISKSSAISQGLRACSVCNP